MRNVHGRTKLFALLLLLAGIGLFSGGCDSSPSNVSAFSVRYLVAGETILSGSALVERVFYDDESGTQTIEFDPPEEGWSNTVILTPGDTIHLRAEGTVASGRLSIQIAVQADDGTGFVRTADNMPFQDGEVWIEIGRETLP